MTVIAVPSEPEPTTGEPSVYVNVTVPATAGSTLTSSIKSVEEATVGVTELNASVVTVRVLTMTVDELFDPA